MNIFVLDENPMIAATSLCDRHVVKMALESVQLICTTAHALGFAAPYKPTHQNHPCAKWLREGAHNFHWLVAHTYQIFNEYEDRYGREHKARSALRPLTVDGTIGRIMQALPVGSTPFAQAMPDQYKGPDAVQAYRAYYLGEKARFATWRDPSEPPTWWHPEPTN